MKKCLMLGTACVAVALLSGCASVVSDNHTHVTITSDIPATVRVMDYHGKVYNDGGKTPITITLPNATPLLNAAEFWLEFSPVDNPKNKNKFHIKAGTNPWFWGNFLFIHPVPVVIGFIIDGTSEARYCFEKNYHFNLTPLKKAENAE